MKFKPPRTQKFGHSPTDELRALIDPDALWEAMLTTDPFEHSNHILGPEAEARLDGGREARERIDDSQHTDLTTGRELVVDKVHRPSLIRPNCWPPVLTQLRLHAPLRRLVSELQA